MLGTQSTNGFRLLATILLVVGFFSVLKPSEFIFGSRGPTNMGKEGKKSSVRVMKLSGSQHSCFPAP
eukprot:m.86012 g.86012  ORF g.86012 m.86012 type:complete len:67 (-) comp25918_c0_seq2:1663-1863(-)